MQNKTKKKTPLWLTIIQIVIIVCMLSVITFFIILAFTIPYNRNKLRFYDTEAVWTCDTLTIETFGGRKVPKGTLKYLGREFDVEFESPLFSDYVDIVNTNPPDIIYQHIFEATAELKGDELRITITRDFIGDSEGNIYILKKQE